MTNSFHSELRTHNSQPEPLKGALTEHLTWWGLRHFESDAAYFQWQRATLFPADLTSLTQQVQAKHAPGAGPADDILFYDLTAQPHIVPVLYSQRYDYYFQIGPRVAERVGTARSIFDFGCGVGILTTFYAKLFPDRTVVGIDRSPASIACATEKAKELGLINVRFECLDLDLADLHGSYDLIVATHALVQVEQDPGIPSRSWNTYERARGSRQQTDFEQRTGIGTRLDRLVAVLSPVGRMIVFEKTRRPARRIPLQRACAARGFHVAEQPELVRYLLVEEIADDGPFYVLRRGVPGVLDWDESPEPDEGLPFDRINVKAGSADPNAPLYENHWPSAQLIWEQLQDKHLLKETTRQEPDGRQLHVELGTAEGLVYLYCANTFDQRQLVIVERARASMLEKYYQEIVEGAF